MNNSAGRFWPTGPIIVLSIVAGSMFRRIRAAILWPAILLAAAIWFGFSQEAVAQGGSKFFDSQWKTIVEIGQWKGAKEARQRKIELLMDEFGKDDRVDTEILWLNVYLLRDDPHAIDAILPRFAALVRNSKDERRLCTYLGILKSPPELPPAVVPEIEGIFRRKELYSYAKPRAAAIVLKAQPNRTDLLQWFDGQLALSTPRELLNAAYAIGWAGKAALPEAKRLAALLKDSHSTVRVIAAEAYWRVTHDAAIVVPVLRSALSDETLEFDLYRRASFYEVTDWTQTREAVECLGKIGKDAAPAAADIARVALENATGLPAGAIPAPGDHQAVVNPPLVVECIHSLTSIGERSPAVRDALESLSKNKNDEIAETAKSAIAKVRTLR